MGEKRIASGKIKTFLIMLLRLILAGLFILSGFTKILNPQKFAIDVARYGILPIGSVNLFVIFLPWIELSSGFFLTLKKFYKGALILLMSLILFFTIAIVYVIIRGITIDCGCFEIGISSQKTGPFVIIRNIIIFIALFYLFIAKKEDIWQT